MPDGPTRTFTSQRFHCSASAKIASLVNRDTVLSGRQLWQQNHVVPVIYRNIVAIDRNPAGRSRAKQLDRLRGRVVNRRFGSAIALLDDDIGRGRRAKQYAIASPYQSRLEGRPTGGGV